METDERQQEKNRKHWLPRIFRILGPGLITGAADDDPSGIATYSQTGAQFGYGQLWTALFLYPFMTAVQEACARIGAVTKKGIAQVVRENYSKKILVAAVTLILVANTVNIGADIGAMASAVRLVVPIPFVVITLLFTVLMLLLEIWIPYKTYARILKWLAATLLVYPVVVFLVHEPWREIFVGNLLAAYQFQFRVPFHSGRRRGNDHFALYVFLAGVGRSGRRDQSMALIKSRASQNGSFRICASITRSACSFRNSSRGASSSRRQQCSMRAASRTSRRRPMPRGRSYRLVHSFPNAGFLAELIFAIGIVGLGLLAVPVLAGSAAYALSEAFSWHEGLYRKFRTAHGFYGVITVATLIGLLINFVGIDPIKALIVTAVLNGVVAVPLIAHHRRRFRPTKRSWANIRAAGFRRRSSGSHSS